MMIRPRIASLNIYGVWGNICGEFYMENMIIGLRDSRIMRLPYITWGYIYVEIFENYIAGECYMGEGEKRWRGVYCFEELEVGFLSWVHL